jgi:hypothetical protein
VLWPLFYFLFFRLWLGGDALSAYSLQAVVAGDGASGWQPLLLAKLALLGALVTSAGGLVWPGWRWLGCALPGLGLVLLNRWMPEFQLRYHYLFLMAPGLLAAALAGYQQLIRSPRRRWLLLGCSGVGLASFLVAGAAPGGQLFAKENFEMVGPDGQLRLTLDRARPGVRAAHARLAAIPPQHGLAAPWPLAAPLADRHLIWTEERLGEQLAVGALPDELTTVALLRENLARLGRPLVGMHGFKLAGWSGGPLEVLTRDPETQHIPWPQLARSPGDACLEPMAVWLNAGLVLCRLQAPRARRAQALFWRQRRAEKAQALVPLLRMPASAPPVPLWLVDGLVNLEDLPVGMAAVLRSDEAVPAEPLEVVLVDPQGRPVR